MSVERVPGAIEEYPRQGVRNGEVRGGLMPTSDETIPDPGHYLRSWIFATTPAWSDGQRYSPG